jgi:signal transduction histidine kinase
LARIRILQVAAVAAGVLGIVAEVEAFDRANPAGWLPDVLVGWACVGFGLFGWSRRPESRTGPLLAAAGFAWFIGNFASVSIVPIAWVASQLIFLHRAVLIHATLTFPTGRIASRTRLLAAILGYAAWIAPPLARNPTVAIAISSVVIVVSLRDYVSAPHPARRARAVALVAAVALGLAFAVATIVHAAVPSGRLDQPVLLTYEAGLILVVALLSLALATWRMQPGVVTDLVVVLSGSEGGTVRDVLASALGDPSLLIGYWDPQSDAYLDAAGQPVPLPDGDAKRTVTRVDVDRGPAAVIVHDPAVLESSELSESIATVARLAAANSRLRSDVFDQLAELRASRRRLVVAGDAERSRLERRVEDGPLRRASALAEALSQTEAMARDSGQDPVARNIAHARSLLESATEDLQELARGLHPRSLTGAGLVVALQYLAVQSPLPVDIDVAVDRLPEAIEAAVYFVCAEGLANVAKHAHASRASVSVRRVGDTVKVEVADDGTGGAELDAGTGLRGLADRVEAFGGKLDLERPNESGTRLVAEIPMIETTL